MKEDKEITELTEVYGEMDKEGKKKMFLMAKQLLSAQLVRKDKAIYSLVKNETKGMNNEKLV